MNSCTSSVTFSGGFTVFPSLFNNWGYPSEPTVSPCRSLLDPPCEQGGWRGRCALSGKPPYPPASLSTGCLPAPTPRVVLRRDLNEGSGSALAMPPSADPSDHTKVAHWGRSQAWHCRRPVVSAQPTRPTEAGRRPSRLRPQRPSPRAVLETVGSARQMTRLQQRPKPPGRPADSRSLREGATVHTSASATCRRGSLAGRARSQLCSPRRKGTRPASAIRAWVGVELGHWAACYNPGHLPQLTFQHLHVRRRCCWEPSCCRVLHARTRW